MIKIFIDGASAGNPGRSGVGYLIYRDGKLVASDSVPLGVQTNNFAEYMALIFALENLAAIGEKSCQCFSDSQLLCEQINGNYKVKNPNIMALFVLAKRMVTRLESFTISHVRREENQEADDLAKKATGFLI